MKPHEMIAYESDASRISGKALDVCHPKSVEEVRRMVLKHERIVIRGSGTGLVGGAVPLNGMDVVLDLSKLERIGEFDTDRMTIVVEAGVILGDLQDYLKKSGWEFPINPASQDMCSVGGMIATDAAGSRTVKYGRTSKWVRWVDVVDSYGNVHRKGVTELSDYAGMEGITGVIVRACLKLMRVKERTISVISFERIEEAVMAVRELKFDPSISMIEFLDRMFSRFFGLRDLYHVVVEYEDDRGELKGEAYSNFIEKFRDLYIVSQKEGYTRIEDFKLMLDRFLSFAEWLEQRKVPFFGTISFGIIHPCFNLEQEMYVQDTIRFVERLGGQVSGAHGIGIFKSSFICI